VCLDGLLDDDGHSRCRYDDKTVRVDEVVVFYRQGYRLLKRARSFPLPRGGRALFIQVNFYEVVAAQAACR